MQGRRLGDPRRNGSDADVARSGSCSSTGISGAPACIRGGAQLLDLRCGGLQFGLTAQRIAAAALAVGELLGLALRGQPGLQVGLPRGDHGGGRVALGCGSCFECRRPGCLPSVRCARAGAEGCGPLGRVEDGGGVGDGGPRSLGDLRDQAGDVRLGCCYFLICGAAAVGEPVLDFAEAVGAEQLLQQGFLVFRVRAQELGELALREENYLEELGGGHAHEVFDLGVDLTDPGRLRLPGAVRPELGEADRGLFRRDAGA